MPHESLREFSELAKKRNIIFYYVGYFSQNIVSAMAETVRTRLETSGAASPIRRKLFSAFVEMSQNIIHYSADALTPEGQTENEVRRGSVCIGVSGDNYFLLSANPVATAAVAKIEARLEPLRSMTIEEIKAAYKTALREEKPDGSKGAGLGFLTLARDASAPLEFEFISDSSAEDTTLFCIKATI